MLQRCKQGEELNPRGTLQPARLSVPVYDYCRPGIGYCRLLQTGTHVGFRSLRYCTFK